jgi:hypothetical protein
VGLGVGEDGGAGRAVSFAAIRDRVQATSSPPAAAASTARRERSIPVTSGSLAVLA